MLRLLLCLAILAPTATFAAVNPNAQVLLADKLTACDLEHLKASDFQDVTYGLLHEYEQAQPLGFQPMAPRILTDDPHTFGSLFRRINTEEAQLYAARIDTVVAVMSEHQIAACGYTLGALK